MLSHQSYRSVTSTASSIAERRLNHPGDSCLGKMAEDSGERGEIHEDITADSQSHEADTADENETDTAGSDEDQEDEDETEEDDEPKLKYARMTGHMTQLYKNGDATSFFLAAGDKMVCLQ